MITDFHSVHTTDTSQCSSVAGSSSEQFEVRRYSQRAAPNSLLEGNFEILVVTEEEEGEEPDFRDEPQQHHHLLEDEEEPRDLKMERYRLALVFASLFFLTWLIAVLVTLGVVLGNRSSTRNKSTTTSTNISPPAELQPIPPRLPILPSSIHTPSSAPSSSAPTPWPMHQECDFSFLLANNASVYGDPREAHSGGGRDIENAWLRLVDWMMPDAVLETYVSDVLGPVTCPSDVPIEEDCPIRDCGRAVVCHDVEVKLLIPSVMGIPFRGCQKLVQNLQTNAGVYQKVFNRFLEDHYTDGTGMDPPIIGVRVGFVGQFPPPSKAVQPTLVDFVVKNTNSIVGPSAVNASGLAQAWPLLAERVVAEAGEELVEGSAYVAFVYPHTPCAGRDEEWTCHTAVGALRVRRSRRANPVAQLVVYAIQDGFLDEILKELGSELLDSWALLPEPPVVHEVSVPLEVHSKHRLTPEDGAAVLTEGWPIAVLKIMNSYLTHDSQALFKRRRQLVELEDASFYIDSIAEVTCPHEYVASCFQAKGVFMVALDSKEEEFGYFEKISLHANRAVQNGMLGEIFNVFDIPLRDASGLEDSSNLTITDTNIMFMVANAEGITDPSDIGSALNEPWTNFVRSKLPREAFDIGITDIILVDCPLETTGPLSQEGLTCHQVLVLLKGEIQRTIDILYYELRRGTLEYDFYNNPLELIFLPPQYPTPTLPSESHRVHTAFVVSNMDSISDPAIIRSMGLSEAWPRLVQKVLGTRRQMKETRQLIEWQKDSAFISSIVLVDCPIGSGEDMTCHKVHGVFSLLLSSDEESLALVQLFEDSILQAIQWGLLDEILQEMGSRLFTGIGEPPSPAEATSEPTANSSMHHSLHLEFQYGFLNDEIPLAEPTMDQLRELVCETQRWLALSFHERTLNPMITVLARNITYNTRTSVLGFAADINTWDGSPLPDLPFLYSSLDLPPSNITDFYMEGYVHAASPWHDDIEKDTNYFRDVSSVDFSTYFGPPQQEFLLEGVTCEDGPLSKQLQMEFTFEFEVAPSLEPTNPQLSALACQTQAWMSQNYQDSTGNKAIVVSAQRISWGNNKLRFIADFHTWDLSPLSILPYYESERVYDLSPNVLEKATPLDGSDNYFTKVANVTYTADYGVTPSGVFNLEETVCSTLTLDEDFLYLSFTFGFYPSLEPEGKPNQQQLSALACESQRWLSKVLQQGSNNSAILLEASSITYDHNQSTLGFVASIETWDNSPVPDKEQIIGFIASISSDSDPFDYILNHVHLASPADGSKNYYRNVDTFAWMGFFGPVQGMGDGALEEAVCASRPYVDYFHMDFNYVFSNDTIHTTGGPSDSQLAALVCQTQKWLTNALQKCWANPLVVLQAKNIAYQSSASSATMTFTADIRTWDKSALLGEEFVTRCLNYGTNTQLSPDTNDHNLNTTTYITNYVYEAFPEDDWSENYFLKVGSVAFSGEFGPPRSDEYILDEATCEMMPLPLSP